MAERVMWVLGVSERLALKAGRNLTAEDVLETLDGLFMSRGVPEHIRSDNGSEFTAEVVRDWLETLEVRPLYIEPGSAWENGYVESFQGKRRDELRNGEVFDTLWEVRVLLEQWRREYNAVRPHSRLGYRAPAPEAWTRERRQELTGALRSAQAFAGLG